MTIPYREYTETEIEMIASTVYELNANYCRTFMQDFSFAPYEAAEQWQKDSLYAGIRNIIENPDTTPEQSHESWLRQKEADGWKYGAVKDPEKKEHPCFVPYDHLPALQRAKDKLFTNTVKTLLAVLNGGC